MEVFQKAVHDLFDVLAGAAAPGPGRAQLPLQPGPLGFESCQGRPDARRVLGPGGQRLHEPADLAAHVRQPGFELFGVERGAFTDARETRPGLFRAAHGGILFLDEIGALPPALQAKLLTVIEAREVRPLGSVRPEPVDVWLMAATNTDLAAALRSGRFREDLFHRLATIQVCLPPLRDRGSDILALAEHYLARACADYGLPPRTLTADSRAALLAYRWPGNVRELANAVERTALLVDHGEISAGDLDLPVDPSPLSDADSSGPLGDAVDDLERARLRAALDATDWNLSQAARRLGLPRNTLRYRLTRLGLAPAAPEPRAPEKAAGARSEPRLVVLLRLTVTEALAPHLERRFTLAPGDPATGCGRRLVGLDPTGLGLAGRPLSRFVGRDQELSALNGLLERVRAGAGQAVVLRGEPGVGKSRVLYEFRERVAAAAIWLEGRCAPPTSATPYGPLLSAVRQALGVGEDDRPDVVATAAQRQLAALEIEAETHAPYLQALLGVAEATGSLSHLSPVHVRLRTFQTLQRFFLRTSLVRPLVVALEDLHWIDPTSDAFLTAFVDGLSGARILLLTTARPGPVAPWLTRSHVSQLALPPLSQADSLAVVRSVATVERLADPAAQSIIAKADGNPFFLEELTWTALTKSPDGLAESVPRSIHDVLQARIDRLLETPRQVLMVAAVLGREVSMRLLRAVAPHPEALGADVTALEQLELLHGQPQAVEPTLVFKHALTQDAAYERLAAAERRGWHRAAGDALERLHAGRLDAVADRLAYHYARAEHIEKAIEYLSRVADRAIRGYALNEAVDALREAHKLAERLTRTRDRDRARVDFVVRQAYPLTLLGRFDEALDALRSQEPVVAQLGDDRLVAAHHFWLAHMHDHLGHRELAVSHANRAIAEATRRMDTVTVGQTHYVLALRAFWDGRLAEGIEHGRQAVRSLRGTPEQWWLGQSSWALSLNAVAGGDFSSALDAARQSRTVAEAISDSRLRSYATWVVGWVSVLAGDGVAGVEACEEALQVARDPLAEAVARQWLSYAYVEQASAARAVALLAEAVRQFRVFRYATLEGFASAWLSEALLLDGQIDAARQAAMHAVALTTELGFRFGLALGQRALGRGARAAGESDAALRHLTDGLQTFSAIEARYEVARTQLDLAAVARRQGQLEAAARHLSEARNRFDALGVPHYAARAGELARELAAS